MFNAGGFVKCSLFTEDSIKLDPRRRMSSTCSEDSQTVAQEIDYDGDGEDSIYYSSTENLHHMVIFTKEIFQHLSVIFSMKAKRVDENGGLRVWKL